MLMKSKGVGSNREVEKGEGACAEGRSSFAPSAASILRWRATQSDINVGALGCSGGLRPPSSIGDRRYSLGPSV